MIKIGTNFYMHTKNKKLVQKYAPHSYRLTDSPKFAYSIHVAKTSMGWLPLFQSHKEGINSVKQYKEFYDTGKVRIFDEYGTEYNWKEFDERVLQFNGGRVGAIEPTKVEIPKDPDYPVDTSMPEYIPVSHQRGNKQSYKYRFESDTQYMSVDDEGYEFEESDFS